VAARVRALGATLHLLVRFEKEDFRLV